MSPTPLILLAEDDENDFFLLKLAFKKAGLATRLIRVRNGQEAIHYLEGTPPYEDRSLHPMPQVAILDIKMPQVDGFDALGWIRSRPTLMQLPVIILSSSDQPSDVQSAKKLGANEYRVKPPDFENLVVLVRELYTRWLTPSPSSQLDAAIQDAALRRPG